MVLKKSVLFLGLIAQACSSSPEINKQDSVENSVATGKNLYTLNCSSCHGADGKLGLSGAKDLTQSVLSDQQRLDIITNGKNAMPSMKEALGSTQNIQSVADYVKSLKK
jgi:cytochrome c6